MLPIDVPAPYQARSYGGAADHVAMAAVLTAAHRANGEGEYVTPEQIGLNYAHQDPAVLATDFVVVDHPTEGIVAYARTSWDDVPEGRSHYLIAPVYPAHVDAVLPAILEGFAARVEVRRSTLVPPAGPEFLRSWSWHPGPGLTPTHGYPAVLEAAGYRATRFGASMVRPDLLDVPDLPLPEGVEVRPVEPGHLRAIWESASAAFAGSHGEAPVTETDWEMFRDDPIADHSLWQVAWHGDRVVGSVRSYVNHEENAALGRERGYTENISTDAEWRGKGIASALLARSLVVLRERGLQEAALGVDTQNPANAFAIYSRLGFRLVGYDAVFDRPLR